MEVSSFLAQAALSSLLGHGDWEIVQGGCPTGADFAAKLLARRANYEMTEFPADWKKYGPSAGPKRNAQMAEYADALILIWDGKSRGSLNMRDEMLKLRKPVFEVVLKSHNVINPKINPRSNVSE